jgi:hypothetical protein
MHKACCQWDFVVIKGQLFPSLRFEFPGNLSNFWISSAMTVMLRILKDYFLVASLKAPLTLVGKCICSRMCYPIVVYI